VIPTRFTSKPPPPNTFLNFQPASNTASFLPEGSRVASTTGNRFLNSNVDFQKEDKAKKLNLQQAKAEIKRANVELLNQKIF